MDMKIIKTLLISFLAVVLVLAVALVIFIKTVDINRFKPQILSQASSALNRKVDFEKAQLALSLRQGVSLRVTNLVIADDPAFAKGDFFAAKDISLAINVLDYLFHKRISVSSALIDGFHITVIRQKDGSINVQTIAQAAGTKPIEQKPGKISAPITLPAILVSSFKGSNGQLAYLDHAADPALDVTVSDLNFTLSKISLTEKFPFTLEGRVLSVKKNIQVEGKVQVNLNAAEVTISELKGQTDLSQILLEKIPVMFPMTKGAVLPTNLKGTAQINLEKMTAGPKGMTALAGDIVLNNGLLQIAQIGSPLKAVQLHVTLAQTKIVLDNFSALLGEGSIKGTGSIDDYLATQGFKAAFEANNIQLADLIAQGMLPFTAQGTASGKLQLTGKGFTPQALSSFLSGTGNIALKKIVLKDVNVFQRVMSKLSMIPGLAEKFESAVPQRYKGTLTQKDTALSDIDLPITIENGHLIIKDTVLSADSFSLKSSAAVAFDGSYTMEGTFLIPADLSTAMVTKIPELQYLLDENKQVFIPLKVSGKAAGAALSIDAGYIAQKLITNQVKTQLMQTIDKSLEKKEPNAASSPNAQGANNNTTSIFGNIFKK
jgi:uncharacterized protein involved in outer membrane biogenesis